MTEQIVQTKTCKNCNSAFHITDKDLEFYDKISYSFTLKGEVEKIAIPTPSFCPECRQQRRLAWRNDRGLYKSKCSATGKQIISMYNPDLGFVVYENSEWRSDKWNPMDFTIPLSFDISFFELLKKLVKIVPRFNLFNADTENCNYVNYAPHCKSCYLLFGSWFCDNCFYGQTVQKSTNCVDNVYLENSENCYENADCKTNYQSFFCQRSNNLSNAYFCYDCENLQFCIGCYNLRNRKYCIENKEVTKEQFENEVEKILKNVDERKKYYSELFKSKAINKFYSGTGNENFSGDFISNCKNAFNCFGVGDSENIKFCGRMFGQKNTYDFEGGGMGELLYENMSNDFSYFCMGCITSERLKNSYYCDMCFDCSNCFGCVGLRKKEYCILNKQYTKEEYFERCQMIIQKMSDDGERGEFFPISMSPFAYNETVAQEYFPLSKDEALKKGYKRKDDEDKNFQGPIYQPLNIDAYDLTPALSYEEREQKEKNINELLNGILKCEVTGRPYRIIKQELDFYLKHNLPIPKKHPDQRHAERMALRNPRKLYDRKCDKCGVDMKTTYAPERKEIVYCEACYNREIYG